jgi:serine/threonine protein kinase, bacterial
MVIAICTKPILAAASSRGRNSPVNLPAAPATSPTCDACFREYHGISFDLFLDGVTASNRGLSAALADLLNHDFYSSPANLMRGLSCAANRLRPQEATLEGIPFGRYRLIELLRRCGMGAVWRPHVPQAQPADRQLPHTGTPRQRRWWRRGAIVVPAALLTAAVIAAAIVITTQQHANSNGSPIALPTSRTQTTQPASVGQVTLPFDAISASDTFYPEGLAVDGSGNVYLAESSTTRVLKLVAGSSTPIVLPFNGLRGVRGLAVNAAGDVYVVNATPGGDDAVLKLSAGSATQAVLPLKLNTSEGLAVDAAGNLYVTDVTDNRVVKIAADSATQDVLPFTGLNQPCGVAVDSAGTVYVADSRNNRVLKLPAGSRTQTVLPFTGLGFNAGVTVNTGGDIYVTDDNNNRVLKLAAGSATQVVLPFTGLHHPTRVAVDTAGNVYVTDDGNKRVLKLPVK